MVVYGETFLAGSGWEGFCLSTFNHTVKGTGPASGISDNEGVVSHVKGDTVRRIRGLIPQRVLW